MPVGLVPGTAGIVPGLVAVSSPPDSVAFRRFSSLPHHRFNMADVDCIRTFVHIHYPTGRRRLVTNRRHRLVAGCPPDSVATIPPDSVATAAASLVPTISSKLSTSAISVAMLRNASQTRWRT